MALGWRASEAQTAAGGGSSRAMRIDNFVLIIVVLSTGAATTFCLPLSLSASGERSPLRFRRKASSARVSRPLLQTSWEDET
jgi:hypothetical protein